MFDSHRVAFATFRLLVCVAVFVCWVPEAQAGAVVLRGGDVLHGEVNEDGAYVTVEHPVLGRLVLPRDQVTAVHADTPPPAPSAMIHAVDQALSTNDLPGTRPAGETEAFLVAGEAAASP